MDAYAKGVQLGLKSSAPFDRLIRKKEEQKTRKNKVKVDQEGAIDGYKRLRDDYVEKDTRRERLLNTYETENNDLRKQLREMKAGQKMSSLNNLQETVKNLMTEKKILEDQIRGMKTAMKEKDESLSTLRLNHEVAKMDIEILRNKLREQELAKEENKTKVSCAVCMEPFGGRVVPQVGSCGHSVCGMCKAALPRKNCPICREELAFRFAKKNFLAEDLLQVVNPYDGAQDLVPIHEVEEEEGEDDPSDLIEFSFTEYEDSDDELEDLRAVRDDSGAESEDFD